MKALVIYYSLEGNTRFVAETIAKAASADILELKPKAQMFKSRGFLKYFFGGGLVVRKKTPELMPLEADPSVYDMIFIGTPVWSWNFTPPLRTFFKTTKLTGKKIALFCTYGGTEGKVFDRMKAGLPGNTFIGTLGLRMPLKFGKEAAAKTAEEWAKDVISKAE